MALKLVVEVFRLRFTRIFWVLVCLQHHLLRGTFRQLRAQRRAATVTTVGLAAGRAACGDGRTKPTGILWLMHWFELGGAESFALHTIAVAKAAGFSTHVFATVPSANHDYAVFAGVADNAGAADALPDAASIAQYIVDNNIGILHIHHSALAYRALPVLRKRCGGLYVIDTTHIVEYRDGGFPKLAARYSDYIDVHHVVSQQSAEYILSEYPKLHGRAINLGKIALRYLLPLPSSQSRAGIDDQAEGVVRVLFFGRFETQKQPYLFCRLIEMLNAYSTENKLGLAFKGVMVGSGSLAASIARYYADALRKGELELLGRIDDKDRVYRDVDILALPSRNEGISLTSYEAIARGVPVVSADVGAQGELLPDEMLVDIWQCNPLPEFVSRIAKFAIDEAFKQEVMERARNKLAELAESPADESWILSLYGNMQG